MLENPYGYIRAADLLLIPSYSEAAPLVIGEAASLGTPILSTETSSAKEMIERTGFGWVCPNSEEGLRDGMQMLLRKPELLQDAQNRLMQATVSNETAVLQFSKMI